MQNECHPHFYRTFAAKFSSNLVARDKGILRFAEGLKIIIKEYGTFIYDSYIKRIVLFEYRSIIARVTRTRLTQCVITGANMGINRGVNIYLRLLQTKRAARNAAPGKRVEYVTPIVS